MKKAVFETGDLLAGKYRVERVLGKGGMGFVVAAIHIQLEERVAVKFLMPELCQQEEPVTRFLREARAAVRIRSEHVARVLDVGVLEDGAPYMVMEYLDGHDLSAELDRRMQLGVHEAVEYVLQACEAIAEAHARGIVHRDLKPANLFLTRRADGSPLVKVLDFGISKAIVSDLAEAQASLTATQSLLGSPHYMSPEQVRKPKLVDARTDIWSLGVILYELLTGSLPFSAENAMSVLAAVVSDPTPRVRETRPDIPEGLEAVVFRCLSKEPGQRFADVAEFAEALSPFAPASAAPSIKRIAGVLRAGAEVSTPPRASSDPLHRVSSEPGAEQQTLVSESGPRGISTDPTLRADFAPRAESGRGQLRSSETASQWEHSKTPPERKAKRTPALWFVAVGLVSALGITGYILAESRAPSAPQIDSGPGSSGLPATTASTRERAPAPPLALSEAPVADMDAAARATPDGARKAPAAEQARARAATRQPAVRASAPVPPAPPSAAPAEPAEARSVDPLEGRR
ncbi:MAG TPA: protein kinase [Polyangiaceae bacterium]|nr:protein kinase [Polyangiaceae bacterium]